MRTKNLLAVLAIIIALPAVAQKNNKQTKWGCHTTVPEKMNFSLDTTKARGLADNYFLWDVGKELNVMFLSGSKQLQQKVIAAAKEWEKHANLKFRFVSSGPAHIRILLTDEGGWWSTVGNNASIKPEDEHTMNLDTSLNGYFGDPVSLKGCVMHEFGHAIGLLHEHSSPLSGIQWNKEAVYKAHHGIWSKEKVDANIFSTYHISYTNGTTYDNKSIMHYPVNPAWTLNNYKVGENMLISEGDKKLVSMLYPTSSVRSKEVARFTVEDFTQLEVLTGAEKVAIYPSFTLNTKGAKGTVYFVVLLYDENGEPLADNDDKFNINGQVGIYDYGMYDPGYRYGANKNGRDFEFSIPSNQIPVAEGTTLHVGFRVLLYTPEEEMKTLYYSTKLVPFTFKKTAPKAASPKK